MRWYYKLPLRLRSIFHKNQVELDLSEEFQFQPQGKCFFLTSTFIELINTYPAGDPTLGCGELTQHLALR